MVKINKPSINWRGGTPKMLTKSRVTRVVVHHPAHQTWGFNAIHNYHRNSLKWAGIGYSWFITRKGNIYQGRGHRVGAHASGVNSTTVGVCFQGDFERGSQKPTQAQYNAFGRLMKDEIIPKYPKIKGRNQVVRHSAVGQTSCPGKRFNMTSAKNAISGSSGGSSGSSSPRYGKNNQTFAQYHSGWWNKKRKDTEEAQGYLKKLGYKIAVDGILGQKTLDAVRDFQVKHKISNPGGNFYGVPGKETMAKLKSEANKGGGSSKTTDAKKGDLVRVLRDVNYRSKASWNDSAVAGKAKKGEAFTVEKRHDMGSKTDLYELKSGTFITTHPNYVKVEKK